MEKKRQLLTVYANLKDGILSYDLSSKSLNIDIIFDKILETLQNEWEVTERLTLLLDYGMAEKNNNYVFKNVSTASCSKESIGTLLNYQKKNSIRKLHKYFSKDKKASASASITDILKSLMKSHKYCSNYNKCVIIWNADKFISLLNSSSLNSIEFNRNYIGFYICLYPDSLFESDYKTLQAYYQPEVESQLEAFSLKLYNHKKKNMLSHIRTQEMPITRKKSLQNSSAGRLIAKMPDFLFVSLFEAQGWVEVDTYNEPDEYKVFKYTNSTLILEAIVKKRSDEFVIDILYDNVKSKVEDVNKFVIKQQSLIGYIENIEISDIQIKLLKEFSLPVLIKLFNNRCITYMVDDYDDDSELNDKFFVFYNAIEKQAEVSIDKRRFLLKTKYGNVYLQLSRKTRNIFKVYLVLLNQQQEEPVDAFDSLANDIKAQINEIYQGSALILPCCLQYILNYRKEKRQTKVQTYNCETKYMINKFSIGILNKKVVNFMLINKGIAYLSFFARDFEEALIALLKKMGFYLMINNENTKSVVFFYNLIKGAYVEDHVFVYFAVRYRKNNIKTIRGYAIKQNPFTPLDTNVMEQIKRITLVINLYIDQLINFIGLYYLTMNQIFKTLNRNESVLFKKTLYWIKYEIPLTYIAFQYKDIRINNDKLRYLDIFRNVCYRETGNYLFKLLNSKSGISNDINIRSAIQFATDTIDMKLLCFDAEYLNKDLAENYHHLLVKYADYLYKTKDQDEKFYIKLLRSELFIILELILTDDSIILRYHLICLKCIKQHLLKLISFINTEEPTKTNFNNILGCIDCKYKTMNSSMFTGRAISNLRSLLDAEYIMLVRKALNSRTSEILRVSDFENVFPITDTETEGINIFAKALIDMDSNKIEFDPQVKQNLSTIFDLIFSTFFEKMNYRLTDDGSIMHLLNFSDKSLDTSKCNETVKQSPLIKLIELNQTFFQSYLKQISSNVNLILIKMYVLNKGNNRYFSNFNKFLDIVRELGSAKKLSLMYRIHSPQFKNLPKKVSSDLYYELKASPELNTYLKNELFSTIYYSSSYTYEFNNIKKKIWKNYILMVFNSFFSCLSLELFFMNRSFFLNHYKYLCKSLENCHNKCVIKFKLLQNDIMPRTIAFDIKKKNYIIINIDKKDSGVSIIPRYAKENVFFNFIFYKQKIEVLWYKSLGFSLNDESICSYCNEVKCLFESKPSITYYELLTRYKTIKNPLVLKKDTECASKTENQSKIDTSCQNMHRNLTTYFIGSNNLESESQRPLKELSDSRKCLELCNSVCDILNIIYKHDAVYLLSKIKNKYIAADEIEYLLEEEFNNVITKPFIKLIYKMHIEFIDIEQNPKKLYYSLLNDPTLSFLRVSADCFLFEIDSKDYLIKLIPVEDIPMSESSSYLLIHFYGVEYPNSGSHFNKIFRIFEQKINQIITKTIENLFFEKKPIIYKNSVIYKYIHKNFEGENFTITVPEINVSILLLYFKQVIGAFLRPVIGELDSTVKGNIEVSHEDIGFFYITVDQNDNLFGGNTIFYLTHDHKEFSFQKDLKLETVDKRYAHNILKDNNLSDLFVVNEDEIMLDPDFLAKALKTFKYNDSIAQNFLTFSVKKKKNELGVDDIGKTIFKKFKQCMVEYYIEAVMSVYMLKYNPFHIRKDLLQFIDIIQNSFNLEPLPDSFYMYKEENKFFKTYLFYNYLTVCKMVEESFLNADLNFVYMYYNQKQDKRIIAVSHKEFEFKMKSYFEERNVLFEDIELNFSLLVLPKGVTFEYCGKKYTPSHKVSAPQLHKLNSDDAQTSIRKKSYSILQKRPDDIKMIYDEIQLYNSDKRKIVDSEETVELPVRRFFYLLNINYDTVTFYTYNLRNEMNTNIANKIDDYLTTIKLKRKLYRFVSIQKLGMHEKVHKINDDYDTIKTNLAQNDNFYKRAFRNFKQDSSANHFKNYTDFIYKLLCTEEINHDSINQLLRDKKFKERISIDFYKLQFSLINNYKFENQQLVHFDMVN